jgi:anaerobic ribonucleoside-triphosphate reductase
MNKSVAVSEMESIALTDDERQPCEIWTRVMGYHRPVSSFNRGKKSEFAERRSFVERRD